MSVIPIRTILAAALLLSLVFPASAAPSGEDYLSLLQESVARRYSRLSIVSGLAVKAAANYAVGGNLWAAGRQSDFTYEACERAGGLMAVAALGEHVPTRHDVILYAVPGPWMEEDSKITHQWQSQGATVISFDASDEGCDERFPVDTVANIIDLWTWTGEFVAACTRLGRMPVLYESYGLPGGHARATNDRGQRFHEDLTVKPISSGELGRAYLNQIQQMLVRLRRTGMPNMLQAARWWSQVPKTSAMVLATSHMFPRHGQDPRTIQTSGFAAVPVSMKNGLLDPRHPPAFVLYLGYQFARPELLDQAEALGSKLAYSSVEPVRPLQTASNILYINPAWPLADWGVTVPGYDIPILPASGVMQAAIYWTIASERARLGP